MSAFYLLIMVSTSYFNFTLAFKEMIVELEVPAYTQTSDSKKMYTMNTTESQMMYSGMGAAYTSNGMNLSDNLTAALKPEICTINTTELLQKKYSEKEQKEVLQQLSSANTKEIVFEGDIKSPGLMSERELRKKVFDSDVVLNDIYAVDNIENVLEHPLVQARLDRFEKYFTYKRNKAYRGTKISKYNNALHIINRLRSEDTRKLINKIHNADFATAAKALKELKAQFLCDDKYVYGNAYPIRLLGIDLLKLVEDDFKTRGDQILSSMGQKSFNEIEQFSRLCDLLQAKNDVAALADVYWRLEHKIATNVMPNQIDNMCHSIVKRALQDPINIVLGDIKYGSWDVASAALDKLEQQVGPIPEQRIIPDKEYLQKSLMHRSKFSRLAAAQKLYKLRPDYLLRSNIEDKINTTANAVVEIINVTNAKEELLGQELQVTQKIEESKVLSIQHNNDLDVLVENCLSKIHDKPQSAMNERFINRINAINETRSSNGECFDYSSRVAPLNLSDSCPKEFQNTYGTELDCQLHRELCHIRNTMSNLEQTYAGNVHVETLAPIVYDYTIQAKCEQSALLAFELTDLCHTITQVLENGMHILYDATTSIGKGVWQGVNNFASIEHWKDMATGMITGPAHLGLLFVDVMSRADDLDYAMIETLTTDNSDAWLVAEEKYRARMQTQNNVIKETYKRIHEMPWQEVVEHGAEIGTTMGLELLALHAINGFASKAGNLVLEELSSALEGGAIFTEEYAVEVAGFGKLAIEEGLDVSTVINQAIENDAQLLAKSTQSISGQAKQNLPSLVNKKNCPEDVINEIATATNSPDHSLNSSVPISKKIPLHKLEESKQFSDILNRQVEELSKTVSNERVGKVLPDDVHILKKAKIDAQTDAFYSKIRTTTNDTTIISKNTHIPEDIIQRIKSHLFLEEHILRDGRVSRFDIDEDIAAAWERLIDNRYVRSDLILLQHEYAEACKMNGMDVASM